MKKILSIISILSIALGVNAQDFKIIGYLQSWGAMPTIQYSKLTHINYSFAEPTTDGTGALKPLDNPSRLTTVVTAAHAANVKVFISVGGYADGNDSEWSTLASNSTNITTFRNNIMSMVWLYQLDGVDIDWEFPSTATEASRFVDLMTSLADTLHKSDKKLTAAVVAYGSTASYISDEIFEIADWINIMAYDNCCSGSHSSYSFGVNSLDYWIARGLAPEKAILGVPFYGRSANGGTYTDYKTAVNANVANAQYDYYDVSPGVTIYYNGIPTIKAKTTYAKTNGGGIMIWELSGDAAGAYSLLSAINEVQPAVQEVTSVKNSMTFTSSLYPNPARDFVSVESTDASVTSFQYSLVDLSGKTLLNGVINGNAGQIPVASLPQGMYVLHLKDGDKVSALRLVKE